MNDPDSVLATTFAGISLRSPIIAASAPPTESVAGMVACAEAGAGAVVTKSIVDYNRADWPNIPRRIRRDRQQLWIQGSFQSETLTLAEGRAIVDATRQQTHIPIIASVGVLDPLSEAPIDTAMTLIQAGASMVHFDLFYLAQPRANDATMNALVGLLRRARATLPVPFGPKLNIDIPAHLFAASVPTNLVDAVFLLDSIRVPPPLAATGEPAIEAWRGGLECSLFGSWQKPISLQYTRVLADGGMPEICAGGGLVNATDVLEALMLGATATQVATQLIIHGYDWLRRANDELAALLEKHGHGRPGAARGAGLRARDLAAPEHVSPLRAVVEADSCVPCGVCTKLAFCPFITARPSGVPTIDDQCYGCGLCETYCPQPGAIRMEPAP